MASFVLQNSDGARICSVEPGPDSWLVLAPPQESDQWKDGYSAKELAKSWFRCSTEPRIPEEFQKLFNSHDAVRGLQVEVGICEWITRIDAFRGKHRHHDQILIGAASGRKTLVGVEAKGVETFGPVIEHYLKDPAGGAKKGSKVPDRVDLLARALFGKTTPSVVSLRYQLCHAFAATLIEAGSRKAEQAVLLVCEFLRAGSDLKRVEANKGDFETFLRMFSGFEKLEAKTGQLYGPIQVPGGKFVPAEIPAYVGKVTIALEH